MLGEKSGAIVCVLWVLVYVITQFPHHFLFKLQTFYFHRMPSGFHLAQVTIHLPRQYLFLLTCVKVLSLDPHVRTESFWSQVIQNMFLASFSNTVFLKKIQNLKILIKSLSNPKNTCDPGIPVREREFFFSDKIRSVMTQE